MPKDHQFVRVSVNTEFHIPLKATAFRHLELVDKV